MIVSIVAAAAGSVLLSCSQQKKALTRETFVMGTKAWITIYSGDRSGAEKAIKDSFRELYRIDAAMSNWKKSSEISILNDSSHGMPVKVSQELFALVDSSFEYSRLTSGAFDITARPLVLLWGFERAGGVEQDDTGAERHGEDIDAPSSKRTPSKKQIEKTLQRVGYERVSLNADSLTITIPEGMSLDLAGVAKGYAIDRCRSIIEAEGFTSALINLGGNIYALGTPPEASGWKVGIRDPRGSADIVGYLLLKDEAVATSGDYENFVEINGKRYGHIIDPKTGYPADGVLSVTVIAPSGLASDALSTGFFVLGPERAEKVAAGLKGVKAVFAVGGKEDTIEYIKLGDLDGILKLD